MPEPEATPVGGFQQLAIRGSVLCFDYGLRRVGVAVGDTETGIAHPLTTIDTPQLAARLAAIGALVAEWRPAGLAVGVPVHMDGAEHERTRAARNFARRLGARFSLPVAELDERLTSNEADRRMREAGTRRQRSPGANDALAAREMLQDYLDGLQRNAA